MKKAQLKYWISTNKYIVISIHKYNKHHNTWEKTQQAQLYMRKAQQHMRKQHLYIKSSAWEIIYENEKSTISTIIRETQQT